jgi:serine/threonine protein phosphatase 1
MTKGKTYCTADWHGTGDVAWKVLKYLKPEDTLYFLGDAIDRGPDGLELFFALLNRDNTFFIRGNHEDMMMRSIPFITDSHTEKDDYDGRKESVAYYSNWLQNGGGSTVNDLYLIMEDLGEEVVNTIKNGIKDMPTEMIYESPAGHTVILEHAGFSPFVKPSIHRRPHDPMWDRDHFKDKWNSGYDYKGLNPETTYLVHGHTPVQYLKFEYGYTGEGVLTVEDYKEKKQFLCDTIAEGEKIIKPTILRYCDNHKIDVDLCTVYSDRIALLDLDTFEVEYFDGDE